MRTQNKNIIAAPVSLVHNRPHQVWIREIDKHICAHLSAKRFLLVPGGATTVNGHYL